ncbi:hypothetical protein GIB67_041112 [Kingdonia uniflora]|uniref:DUF7356 domain-containing protein n=1 Tax=Kingdonia uniflora TaxID=39325 RepID=A0A7J7LKI5_9MAGN|nr:hypothetical protein GIB67_041112 [Kingdonia uniflora]
MGRNRFLAVILVVVLIVMKGSDATMLRSFRRMVGIAEEKKTTQKEISPSPSPISDNSSINGTKESLVKDPEKASLEGIDEKCEPLSNMCTYQNMSMVACLQPSGSGSQELFLLVQNDGENTLKVNVTVPDSVKVSEKELKIPKHKAKKVNVSVNVGESREIVLNAGEGNCVLHTRVQVSESNFFKNLPYYANRMTLIYGAYFLFGIALVIGAGWACCKFGKKGRRVDGKVAYQELEMGTTGVDSAVNVGAADGWDEGWDDDWDEERAVKPQVGSVSANGLTSRSSSNRDGWDNNWDD